MDNLRNRNVEHLGVNKIGKNIRKSPLHQPSFASSNGVGNNGSNTSSHSENSAASVGSGVVGASRPQQPQPQVYNVSKNEFRNIVQQLTGSPARDPLPRPASNPPKPPSMRLQRIRPPPLAPLNRPPPQVYNPLPPPQQVHVQHQQIQRQHQAPGSGPGHVMHNSNHFVRPGQFGQPSPVPTLPVTPVDTVWANTAESPISAYMRYLQNSIVDAPRPQHRPQQQNHPQQLPHPSQQNQLRPPHPSQQNQLQQPPPSQQPQRPAHPQQPPHPHQQMQQHLNGQLQPQQHPSSGMLPNPPGQPFPSPRMNGPPPLLPSPTSQYLLPSPNGYMNFPTPWSPYPILSPNGQFPPPLTPTFPFSPMGQFSGQFGILGPGPGPQFPPPPSPAMVFPISPSGFFPIVSPRWREQ